ncbi:MAG: hypothetical protein M3P98_03075 [bacterium]|nr:hypothetical protein [bacterium]
MEISKEGITFKRRDDLLELLSDAANILDPPDEKTRDLLKSAHRAGYIPEVNLDYLVLVEEMTEAGLEFDPVNKQVNIPWQIAPMLGKACLHILSNPQSYRPYIDGSCGGYTVPWAVKEAFENIGKLSAALAVQENFTSYHYSNPYER